MTAHAGPFPYAGVTLVNGLVDLGLVHVMWHLGVICIARGRR